MRVGSLVYSTQQGLGILAKSFYDAGVVTDVVVVAHPSHTNQTDWYPESKGIVPRRGHLGAEKVVRDLLSRVDVMLFFETPFDWSLIRRCREMGKRTFLMTMYECTPKVLPAVPDVFLCPSLLDLQYFRAEEVSVPSPFIQIPAIHGKRCCFTPIPVQVPWGLRTRAETFVHNAGWGSFHDRNGTNAVHTAWRYVESPAKLIIRSQKSLVNQQTEWTPSHERIKYRFGTVPYDQLWHEGDVFIFPERFNGLSLPLQEARAAGMLVIAGDRFPMNTWLPTEPLIMTDYYKGHVQIGAPYNDVEYTEYDPKVIAAKVDEFYGKDITVYSESGRVWAESMSWERLKPKYLEVLSS